MATLRFMIVDDHPLFRGAMRQALNDGFGDTEIVEAGSFDELVELLGRSSAVDLALLDLSMPGVKGFSGLLYMRAQYPEVPVAIVSATEEAAIIRQAVKSGASGFIPKSTSIENIREAIQKIMEGELWVPTDIDLRGGDEDSNDQMLQRLASLTPQQVRVLMMLSEGLLNKQIAYKFGVSEATIKAHVSAILQKLGVDSRTQAVIALSKIDGSTWQRPEL